jgi:hypothetical protein
VKTCSLESSASDPTRAFGANSDGMLKEHERTLERELQVMNQDGQQRVFIDYFEDRENSGIKYKGQW